MLVDISVILKGDTALIVAGTLSVVALFGKWFAALVTQLAFKYSKTQRQLIFGLSSSHAAATLAVILVGYKAKILDENILNGTIILILITCVVASFVTEKAAKKLVVGTEDDSTGPLKVKGLDSEHILLPIANIGNMDKLLEFSIFIKGKKSANPLSVLSVVSNNNEAENNILKARKKLEQFVEQASATETKVSIIATIDHNAASGISRISKEIMADIIVLGWPERTGFIDKLIGEKVDSIISNTDKTTIICHFEKPLATHQRMVIAAPPLTEHEKGFGLWFGKMAKLAQELSIPLQLYCNEPTLKSIQKMVKDAKISAAITASHFNDWDNFQDLSGNVLENDLFVLVSAREGAASYMAILENLPSKVEKYFPNNSRLIIYPQQFVYNITNKRYDQINPDSLNKGIETIQKIGKGIGSIFKKDNKE